MLLSRREVLKIAGYSILTHGYISNASSNPVSHKKNLCENKDLPSEFIFPFGVSTPFYQISQQFVNVISEKSSCKSIVISKPGANGLVAMSYITESKVNTPKVLISSTSTAILNGLSGKAKPDFQFEPLGMLFRIPSVMVCRRELGNSLEEFLKNVSQRQVRYSTTGVGGLFDILGKAYAHSFKFDVLDVPYNKDHLLPLLSGEVDFTFVNPRQAREYSESGHLTCLLRTGGDGIKLLPRVPSVSKYFSYLEFQVTWGLMINATSPNFIKDSFKDILVNSNIFNDQGIQKMATMHGLSLPRKNALEEYSQSIESEKRTLANMIRRINFNFE